MVEKRAERSGFGLIWCYSEVLGFTLYISSLDNHAESFYDSRMQVLLNIKIDPRMKAALKEFANKQFISVSAVVKQAIEKYLQERGVDWRKRFDETIPAEHKSLKPKLESGAITNRYHTVEISISDTAFLHQFKIWDIAPKGSFILVKEGSDLLDQLKVGDVLNMKYHTNDSVRPTEYLDTEITSISKDDTGRFRGHYLVGISIQRH